MGNQLLLLMLLLALVCPVGAATLIDQAYTNGRLDLATAQLYQAMEAREPESVPAELRGMPTRATCGTPALVTAVQFSRQLGDSYSQALAKVLARPSADYHVISPSRHFRIHYDISGSDGVDPEDTNANGYPDYVDAVAATLDSTWTLQVESLAFNAPPTDGILGGGPEYDVYIEDLGRGRYYGLTYPEGSGATTTSYLVIDNNYTDSIYRETRGLDALHVTVAHEFNHSIQFGYYQGSDGIWWQEATSTWMEDVAYPAVNDYLQYIASFLLNPEYALNSGAPELHIYGAALFAHFLDQHYGRDLIRRIWAEIGARANANLDHFDRVVRTVAAGGMGTATSEFAVWNYFTGTRYRRGYYHEGDKYPTSKRVELQVGSTATDTALLHEGTVDHLGSTFLSFQPQVQQSGGIRIQLPPSQGQWLAKVLLVSRDSVEVHQVTGNAALVPSWSQYTNVVVVLTETDLDGWAFPYSLSVTYDPDLIDAPPPEALALGPSFPNPFLPDQGGLATIPFDLSQASLAGSLSIYSADGNLVWQRQLGQRAARSFVEEWDGGNSAGRPVSSGVYYCVLQTDHGKAVRTMAVVRGTSE